MSVLFRKVPLRPCITTSTTVSTIAAASSSKNFKFLTNTDAPLSSHPSLVETLPCLPRGFARENAFDAPVHRLCKLERRYHARHDLDVMFKLGDGLNAATFHPFLLSLDHSGLGEARRVVETMQEHQVCCARCDVGSAAGVLEEMEAGKVDTTVSDVLCRMAKDGVSPPYSTLVVLIKWMASREVWGEAVGLARAHKGRCVGEL